METKRPSAYSLEDYAFIGLVIIVTIIFAWLLAPYFGAILWGIVAAILFEPLTRRLERRLGGRPNTAATLILLLLLAIFILPTLFLGASHGGIAARPSQSAAKASAILAWFDKYRTDGRKPAGE